jgi:hypothetical protein
MTVDGVWIGNRIFWTLWHTTPDCTLQIAMTHRLVFSATVFAALLGNGFQQWTFLCSRAHGLAGYWPSHTDLLPPSQYALVMAAGLCYITSSRTAQKTSLSTGILLLGRYMSAGALPSKEACFQSRSLSMALSAGFTTLVFSRRDTLVMLPCFLTYFYGGRGVRFT